MNKNSLNLKKRHRNFMHMLGGINIAATGIMIFCFVLAGLTIIASAVGVTYIVPASKIISSLEIIGLGQVFLTYGIFIPLAILSSGDGL